MTALNETAYPELLEEPRPRELSDHYTPIPEELDWARKCTPMALKRVGLLILLKCVQRLGYFPQLRDVPRAYLDHVTVASGFARPLYAKEIVQVEADATRHANMELVRRRMDIRPLRDEGWLRQQAEQAAQTQHQIPDIVNILIERLIRDNFELPGFRTLERAAKSARDKLDEGYYDAITHRLSADQRDRIDRLFKSPDSSTTAWNALKQEPARPTNPAVRQYLEHVRELKALSAGLPPVNGIPVAKLKSYQTLARAQNAAEMAELKPNKRYALAVVYIRSCHARALDDAADLYIRLFGRLQHAAERRLREYLLERGKTVDTLIGRFHDTLLAYLQDGNIAQRMKGIDITLGDDAKALAAMCEEHMSFANQNYRPFLLMGYPSARSLLFNCLEIVKPRSTSQVHTTEELIAVLEKLRASRAETVSLAELDLDGRGDMSWLSMHWRRLVPILSADGAATGMVHRKYLELAIHERIRDDFQNGDLFIEHGEKYDDYREQLVDRETFEREAAEYGEVTGIPVAPKALVEQLRGALARRASEVDRGFKHNDHASIVDGKLSLRRLEKTDKPAAADKLDLVLRERLPPISILDVMVDVNRWLGLDKHFRSIAGTETRLDDLQRRFITTLFCYGCNLGATQTSRSMKGINRRQIAWLNVKYVSEESLDKAIVQVTNAYAKFELPSYWGGGKSASADGMKWGLYEQNLMSEYHIRYGGYGGIGYYLVSDMYIALFSRFIACGVYEGTYILDGLIKNESDIQPDTLHGDTHAQNYAVFAVAFLLGIKLMPRIARVHNLSFFKPSGSTKYRRIEDLFDGTINWKLIEAHYEEMLRVVVSIKLGKITASTILRRFGNKNRSKLADALRELGKVIRTLFLLDFLETAELRKAISAATNKSEAFNNFIQWVFFGGEGIIQENVAHEQRKVIKYSHLVANMVCLHNVQAMTVAIRQLRAEGMEITEEVLGFLSPYRTWHINRFGDYFLDFDRTSDPMDPDLKILP